MTKTYHDLVRFAEQITQAGSIANIYFGSSVFTAKKVESDLRVSELVFCVGTDDQPMQIDSSAIIAVRDNGPEVVSFGVL